MKSAVSQFYKDLLFYEPSEQEVELSLDYIGGGTYGEYVFERHLLFWIGWQTSPKDNPSRIS